MNSKPRLTSLPTASPPLPQAAPNPAGQLQRFVGEVTEKALAPVNALNLAVAKATLGFVRALPKFPAVRLYSDLVLGWPHSHPHPPTFGVPLPSIGPVICAGSRSVLINGLPAARVGDLGFGAWCGGYFPIFEVFTGSSHVFIGGARPARQLIDFTKHCLPGIPGFGKLGVAMMTLSAGMGALDVAASLGDKRAAEERASGAETETDAEVAEAEATAAGVGASTAVKQMVADVLAAVLQAGMGKDPGMPPFLCMGNFITGSPDVVIGGFPMPGWISVLRGLGKLLRKAPRVVKPRLPRNAKPPNARCAKVGHPVDVASGRVFTFQVDFVLPGRIPVEFKRAYDTSATDYSGVLGPGWTHPLDIHLWADDEQGMVILRNEEARVVGFDPVGIGEKSFNPVEKLWLERTAYKEYVVRDGEGMLHRFSAVETPGQLMNEAGRDEAFALRLVAVEDRNGNSLLLNYEDGRLSSLEGGADDRLVFKYRTLDDGSLRLHEIWLESPRWSYQPSRLITYSYDETGHLTGATDRGRIPWLYSYTHNLLTRETNRNKLNFYFEYEGDGADSRCVHTWGDKGIYERRLSYHPTERKTVMTDSLGGTTTYYFNELDLPLLIVDAQDARREYVYGAAGELLSETDEAGRTKQYAYNDNAACVRITHPDGTKRELSYNEDGLPQALTDEAGAKYAREYDAFGNPVAVVDALGSRYEMAYNESGDPIRVVDPLGGVTQFNWNERGQLVNITTPGGAVTRHEYDPRGRLEANISPVGDVTRYSYDAQDRPIVMERADGSRQSYEYDPEGNLSSLTDSNGGRLRFLYEGFNKLAVRVDAAGLTQRFAYDTEERLIKVGNERGETYGLDYDPAGRVTREVGFDGCEWTYEYDLAGELLTRTDPLGRRLRFVRDQRGRVVRKEYSDGAAVSFHYDPVGRFKEAHAPGSNIVFEYDALGSVVSEEQNGHIVKYGYDALGRRVTRSSTLGRTITFSYDADGGLGGVEVNGREVRFERDGAGRLVSRRLPGQLEEFYEYTRSSLVKRQSLRRGGDEILRRSYKYDAEGNLTELDDAAKGVTRFAYDALEQLREVVQPQRELEQFDFDPSGNLLRRGERVFRYEQGDRLTRSDGTTLTYDAAGNLIEKRRAGTALHYSYDCEQRLIAVESKPGGRVEFSYDAFGRRVAKKSEQGETEFLWDGDVLLAERRADVSTEYVFGLENHEPLCRFSDEVFENFHNDHLGTPRELTDESGQVVWSASYDVYGGISRLHAARSANHLRFQGQYEDAETGLYYNGFRYYDPGDGRFITQDPAGLAGGLNPYQYACNPVNWIDPLGLTCTGTEAKTLPALKGMGVSRIEAVLAKRGFIRKNPANPRNQRWAHPDGSEVAIHAYGNKVAGAYKSGNNAHVHKSVGRHGEHGTFELDDRGHPSVDAAATHIGIRNPRDFPTVAGRPHGT